MEGTEVGNATDSAYQSGLAGLGCNWRAGRFRQLSRIAGQPVNSQEPSVKELIARLPRTFVPAINEKLNGWQLLFPAEQRLLTAQLTWLAELKKAAFDQLFAPVNRIEGQMELPKWRHDASSLSIEDTAIIARSPYYPQWRTEVERVFEHLDDGVERAHALPEFHRLLICVFPRGFQSHVIPGLRSSNPVGTSS